MGSGWKTDFDGALRLEVNDLILRVKQVTRGWDWGVYKDGVRKWTGWHEGEDDALRLAKQSASRCGLKTILYELDAPDEAVDAVIAIMEYEPEEQNYGG